MSQAADLNRFLASVEKRAYAMAVTSVKNPEDALDIVQDVMLTLARKYANKPQDQWPPLFYRILKNRITDWHRSQTVRNRWFGWIGPSNDDDSQEDPIEQVGGSVVEEPDHKMAMDHARERLSEALALLPARQREAFMFRAWEGLNVKSTAAAMGCSEGSVKTHYSRAVHALRVELESLQEESGNE